MYKRQIAKDLKDVLKFDEPYVMENDFEEGEKYHSYFIGSFLSLDPCGRYHHILSPNGITRKCEIFWEELEEIAQRMGGWIESGEGDPLDTFFCLPIE